MIANAAAGSAGVIREYLERNGSAEVPFHHLLTTWGIEEPTALDRQEISDQLRAAGIEPGVPLGELAPDDVVTLTLDAPSEEPAMPPWFGDGTPREQPTQAMVASAPPTLAAPAEGPPSGRGRRWLRVTLAITGLVAVLAGAAAGAFYLGQDTRLSDEQVGAKLERLAADDKRVYTERENDSLRAQERSMTRERRTAVSRARKSGQESGYTSGQTAGYSAGNAAGYSSGHASGKEEGHEEGVEDGLEQGSDELTCSDDLDVPLPACDY